MEEKLIELGQKHILKYYNKLNEVEKKEFLSIHDISKIEIVTDLYQKLNKYKKIIEQEKITSADIKYKKDYILDTDYIKIGENIIKNGEVGIVILAGGLGTRLGHNGPKGTFEFTYKGIKKSLFEFLIDKCKIANKEFNVEIPIYILCSNNNKLKTEEFFKTKKYFLYPPEKIKFLVQEELPILDMNGKVLLKNKKQIAYGPNGNGNVFKSLNKSGYLKEMKKNNIKWLIFTGIDNIFVNLIDPLFIGLTIGNKKNIASKSITKIDEIPNNVFVKRNDKYFLIETQNLSKEKLNQKDQKGNFLYREYDVLCHLVNYNILRELAQKELDYHKAIKKTQYYKDGKIINPIKENSYKFETFIYEAFYDNEALIFSTSPNEFLPLKNKSGKYSIKEVQNCLNIESLDI